MYREIFSRARKRDTLDIMVRKQARLLGIEFRGNEEYLLAAFEYPENNDVCAMFSAAHNQFKRIREQDDAVLSPSSLFE